jgi:polyphosphate kinase 2 (PPK2 family)
VSDLVKKKTDEQHDAEVHALPAAAQPEVETRPAPKMKRKEYEREMRVLHGELVAIQEWVKASGAKICIVFEGRDTAGKGGTIKRITDLPDVLERRLIRRAPAAASGTGADPARQDR